MKKIQLYVCLITLLSIRTFSLFGQFVTSSQPPYHSPDSLIQNVLLGSGVTALNISYYGDTVTQLGFFNAANTNFGLDSGIVLTTGNLGVIPVGGASIPNGGTPTQGDFGPTYFGVTGNNALLDVSQSVPALIGGTFPAASSVNDASVLEFDFIPISDSVSFRYIFSSDEWNTYPCTQYNDVFGFFVSGPGITGTFPSPAGFPNGAINIASVPGTSPAIPITISSIHPGGNNCGTAPLNDQFFVNNQPNVDISYNGFTTILTATFATVPCDTYHIALAIGDGTDGSLDSGVFLEAKSFSATPIEISAEPNYTSIANVDSNFYEGCGSVSIDFERFVDVQFPYTVYYLLGGNAIEGIDFANIPDSIDFAPGQSIASLTLDIFDDGVVEGVDTLIITIIPDTTVCYYVPGDTSEVVLYIHDKVPVEANFMNDTIDCLADSAYIAPDPISGIPYFQYMWSTGDTVSDTLSIVAPMQDTTIYVTYTDACFSDTLIDSAQIIIQNAPLIVSATPDTLDCTEDSLFIGVEIVSGSAQQYYQWGNGAITDSIWVHPVGDTVYYVTITDACVSDTVIDSVEVYNYDPPFVIDAADDTITCVETSTTIGVSIISGTGPHTYTWSNSSITDSIVVSPTVDTFYTVTITDQCEPDLVDSIWVRLYSPPLEVYGNIDTLICTQDSIHIGPHIISATSPGYLWSTGDTTDSIWVSPNTDTVYTVIVTDACDLVSDTVDISIVYDLGDTLQANFSIDTVSCAGDVASIVPIVTGGFSTYSFQWNIGSNDSMLQVPVDGDTSFVVTITDQCGAWQVIDTIYTTVQTHAPLVVAYADTVLYCAEDSVAFVGYATGGAGSYTFSWEYNGAAIVATDTIEIPVTTVPQEMVVTVMDLCGETAIDSFLISAEVHPQLNLVAMNDTSICLGDELELYATVSGGAGGYSGYDWTGSYPVLYNIDSSLAYVQLLTSGVFYVSVFDVCGTYASDSVLVDVDDCAINPPNVITPNGDGINDFFYLADVNRHPGTKLWIYNRWGELMYEDDYYRNNWGGEFLTSGVYFWRAEFTSGEKLSGYLHIFQE
ncbi:MAG: hypothetical protein CL843_11170 [Crocinitomicaceae bacterium]|nr:hypothetical protein [Crocinitomicaceae bacterium]